MRVLAGITRYAGVATSALLGTWIVLLVLFLVVTYFTESCHKVTLTYRDCFWRGTDVSYEVNMLAWTGVKTYMAFLASGMFWLTSKCLTEWRNPEYTFARWWLVLFAVFYLFVVTAPRFTSWLAA